MGLKWLETHKHLAIALVISVFVLLIVRKVIASSDQQAHDRVVLAEDQLKRDQSAQKAADAQAKTDAQAFQVLKQQLDSKNAQLKAQIAGLAASLRVQQEKDRALPVPELAERWEALVNAAPGEIKPIPDGLAISERASRNTVVLLEEIQPDRQALQKQADIIKNSNLELDSAQKSLMSASDALNACKTTQVSADLACKAELKEEKAKGRKRNMIVAVIGAIFGFLLRSKI